MLLIEVCLCLSLFVCIESSSLSRNSVIERLPSQGLRLFHPSYPLSLLDAVSEEEASSIIKIKRLNGIASTTAESVQPTIPLPWKPFPELGISPEAFVSSKNILDSYEKQKHQGYFIWARKLEKPRNDCVLVNHWSQRVIHLTQYSITDGAVGYDLTSSVDNDLTAAQMTWPPLALEFEMTANKWQAVEVSENLINGDIKAWLPKQLLPTALWEVIYLLLASSDSEGMDAVRQALLDTGLSPRRGLIAYLRLLSKVVQRGAVIDDIPDYRTIREQELSLSFALPRFLRDLRSCSSLRIPAPVTRLSDATAGIYIHIPFCRRRCFYCDFPIKVIGDRESSRRVEGNSYTQLLLRDITSWSSLHGMQQISIDSIYFGGGTPSLLPDDCIEIILNHLRDTFRLSSSTEITFEMDPGTFDYDRILRLRTFGINRLSIGVQSFREDMLKVCGRVHTVSDVSQALDDLSRAQWDNFSIDLISSLPHHTMNSWSETLQSAIQSNCPHISVYDLQVEDKTAFSKWYSPGVFPLPAEELSADMFGLATRLLTEAGYEHYEVSNYALPGKRSRHNQKYWRCAPILAFGMSAVSYLSGDRFARPRTLETYATYVDQLEHEQMMSIGGSANKNNVSTIGSHVPDVLDVLMLSLRTADGIDAQLFSQQFGDSATSKLVVALLPYIQRGIVMAYDYDGTCLQHEQLQATYCSADILAPHSSGCCASRLGRLRLSDPQGFLISNDVISTAFAAFS